MLYTSAVSLLQIIFSQNCDTCGGSGSFLSDLTVNIFGALIGTGTALLIFYLTNRQQIRSDNQKKQETQRNKLYYFASLLKSSIAILKQQKRSVAEFIYQTKKEPLIFPEMSFTPMTDIKRILESLNLEDYFLSYTDKYGTGIDVVREYKSIIDALDFEYSTHRSIVDQLAKGQHFDHERKLLFRKDLQEANIEFGEILFDLEQVQIPIGPQIQQIFGDFVDNLVDKSDFQYYHDHFIVPLHNLLTPYIVNPNNPMAAKLKSLAIKLKELRGSFDAIKLHNKQFADELLEQLRMLAPELRRLEKLSVRIFGDFT